MSLVLLVSISTEHLLGRAEIVPTTKEHLREVIENLNAIS
jgi:hypothetical protein